MIILDSTFMIAFLHPNPETPMDDNEKPVERFKDRISALISSISASGEKIGIPAPVVAEILVLYPENKYDYLNTLRDRYRFEIVPFGVKAAIEASDLIATLAQESKQSAAQWRKVKFDIQIAAIAKAESATIIYADDKGIINNAKRLKIAGKRICDLPLPPDPVPPPKETTEGQAQLFDQQPEAASEDEVTKNESDQTEALDQLEADSAHSALIRGSDEGRVESEAPGETKVEAAQEEAEKPKAASDGGLREGGS